VCKDRGRQFVENPQNKRIPQQLWDVVGKLLLTVYQSIDISKNGRLTVECDEMWSFVGLKRNKQWIWLAIDSDSRKIVRMHVGSRDRAGVEALWKSYH